jgi:cytochrome bd-type quinol oxidase subunit 2
LKDSLKVVLLVVMLGSCWVVMKVEKLVAEKEKKWAAK